MAQRAWRMEQGTEIKGMPDETPSAKRHAPCAFFLVGATACGKSAVAQYIAEREGQRVVPPIR